MNSPIWPKRLYALDVSRGLVAMSVVLWHWSHFAQKGTVPPANFARDSQPLYPLLEIFYEKGLMGVQYFFLLSGFIFFWLYRERLRRRTVAVWKFTVQRFSRLYPLHLATLIVVALLQMVYNAREGSAFVYPNNSPFFFGVNVLLASSWGWDSGWAFSFNGPAWTVSVEVLLYIAFFIAASFLSCGMFFCLGVSLATMLLSQVLNYAIFNGLSMFFLGGLVYQLTAFISAKRPDLKPVVYALAALATTLVLINFYVVDVGQFAILLGDVEALALKLFPFYIFFPLVVSALTLLEIDYGSLFWRRLAWVGDISYASYLLHFPLQLVFMLAVSYGLLNADFYLNPLSLIIFFAVLIPLSHFVFLYFEVPMQKAVRELCLPQRQERQVRKQERQTSRLR